MIDYLEIQNYKMFEKLRLDGLGRVNLIVGKNNVGKSSLLEIGYIASALNPAYAFLRMASLRRLAPDTNIQEAARSFFPRPKDFSIEPFQLTVDLINPALQVSWGSLRGSATLDVRTSLKAATEAEHKRPQRLIGSLLVDSRGLDDWEAHTLWDYLDLAERKRQILDALRLAEPKIQSVALILDGNELRQPYVRIADQDTPLASMGEGMSRLFGLAFALGVTSEGYLFIDEIENGLHYELHEQICSFIFEVAAKLNVQVFLTTHSLDFTRAFTRAAAKSNEEGKLYRLDKTFGTLEVLEYGEEDLIIAANQGIEVR